MSTLHFWPDDLVNNLPASPLTVLREAASELGQKTRGAIEVELRQLQDSSGNVQHQFVLVSEMMNFRYGLLSASFDPIELYPCSIRATDGGGNFVAQTDEELRIGLAELLRSPKAISVVKAMLAQSQ